MSEHQVVVVGAGPAGLSAALALKDVGLRPLVVDRAAEVGSSWRGRYDRLRLNTSRALSHLPDRRFPKGTPMFPTRDQLVDHLERHAREGGLELLLGTDVARIDPDNGSWEVATSGGELMARQVILSTGYEGAPFTPDWSGRESFEGTVIHAAEYRNPGAFAGMAVLVVGPGCSGMEIAYDLATGGAAKVWLSARTPPNIVLRTGPGGLPGDLVAVTLLHLPVRLADAFTRAGRRMDLGDLSEYGLPVPDEGVFARLRRTGAVPAIVDREVIDAIKDGRIEVVRGVEALDRAAVRLADGRSLEPEALVAATGYRRGLEPLVGHLGVLDARGMPRAAGPVPAIRGLRFVGYTSRPGALGYMSKEAKRAARAIAGELA
jgi:cation diffusion facilitator CzcD-associated flavoprotein CzcO